MGVSALTEAAATIAGVESFVAAAAAPAASGIAAAGLTAKEPAAAIAGGGETLPGAGKGPPVSLPLRALPATGRRLDLPPMLLSVAAKSRPLPFEFKEPTGAVSLSCVGSAAIGACETMGVAFIASDLASDVPTAGNGRSDLRATSDICQTS
jgi:hypothetical protein